MGLEPDKDAVAAVPPPASSQGNEETESDEDGAGEEQEEEEDQDEDYEDEQQDGEDAEDDGDDEEPLLKKPKAGMAAASSQWLPASGFQPVEMLIEFDAQTPMTPSSLRISRRLQRLCMQPA